MPGLQGSASAPGITPETVAQARQWGANLVRVPLGEQFWLSSNCDYSPSYVSTVDQVVDWITSLHMIALLDLHFSTVGGCEPGGQHNMADEAQSPEFWQEVASRYASNPYVAFDLYNEPHNISDAIWLDGGTTTDVYFPNQTYEAAGMQQLYEVVRSTGAKNLVFVSGNTWYNTVPQTLVSGFNVVYAPHVYTCPGSPPPNCSNANPYDPSQILDNWVPVWASVPIVVTEFGWPNSSSGTFNSNVIAFASSHDWGWAAFAWTQSSDDSFNIAAWDGVIAEPTQSGLPILQALGGSP